MPAQFEFAKVQNPDALEGVLRRAQFAILNPHMDPASFVNCSEEDLKGIPNVQLSPNLVRLDIQGPKCPDLTFYDLPGIFNRLEDDRGKINKQLGADVRQLALDYVRPTNNIILLACAMDVDPELCSAADLIDQAGANSRTIGSNTLTTTDNMSHGPLMYVNRSFDKA